MEYKDYKKDLEYWETHSPEAVLKYQEAFELVNDEVKEKEKPLVHQWDNNKTLKQ